MDFDNLDSEETLQKGLLWISSCISKAMENGDPYLNFTFTPNENNSIEKIFVFILQLKEILFSYNYVSWCILDNVSNKILMKIIL